MNWPCRLNDDGWKSEALEKADGYEIAIEGTPGIERLLADIREKLHNEQSDEDKNEQSTDKDDLDDITNCTLCCKSRSRGVVITLKSLKLGLSVRKHCKWVLEFEGYTRLQSVKVGPGQGPVYAGRIGGKFYDLTAQRKKGVHLKQYRLNEGAW